MPVSVCVLCVLTGGDGPVDPVVRTVTTCEGLPPTGIFTEMLSPPSISTATIVVVDAPYSHPEF